MVEEFDLRGILNEESPRCGVLFDVGDERRQAGKTTPSFSARKAAEWTLHSFLGPVLCILLIC